MDERIKILAVDDKPDNLITLKAVLTDLFPQALVMTVSNGPDAIQLAQSEDPDVILLDIIMPGMDGFTVCQKIKEDPRSAHIPVVFLTASKQGQNSRVRALESGAEAFLSKPLDDAELTAQIRAMVKIKQASTRQRRENERLSELVAERTRELENQLAERKKAQHELNMAYVATLNLLEDLKTEIDARIQKERALRESEADLKKAQKVARLGSWVWHIQADRLEWSEEMYEIFGIPPEEFTGKWDDVVTRVVHPDDLATQLYASQNLESGDQWRSMQYRVIWPDGTVRVLWDETDEMILDEQGRPLMLNGITQDVTERVQIEQQLRLQAGALEAAANAIVITDPDGNIEWINAAFTSLTGYSAAECIGQNPRLLKSGLQDPAYYKNLWDTIQAGRSWQGELVNKRKDGSLYTEEETITPLLSPSGQITHFIGVKQNITQRKLAEEESRRFSEVLVKVNQAGRAMAETLELDTLYGHLNDAIHNLIPDICAHFVLLFEPQTEWIRCVSGCHQRMPVEVAHIPAFKLERSAKEPVSEVIITGQPVAVDDLQKSPLASVPKFMRCTMPLAGSMVLAPMFADGKIVGVLHVQSQTPARFDSRDITLLTLLANTAAVAIANATLHGQTEDSLRKITVLRTIDQAINSSFDLTFTLNTLVEQAAAQLKVDAVSVLLLDPHTQTLDYAAGCGFRSPVIQSTHLRLGDQYAGQAVLENRTLIISDLETEDGGAHKTTLTRVENFVSYFATPLMAKGQAKGVLEIFHRSQLDPQPEWIDFFETLANQAAIAIDNGQLFEGLQRSNLNLTWAYDATIEGWSRAMDLRDHETEGHTQRVTELTMQLAKAAGISGEQMVHIRRGALLHDIGKLGVPDQILLKPEALTPDEWVIMRRHPQYAYDMLYPIEYLRPALDIPYCHHEKWDGTGYPRGLKIEEIPFAARLFALVDVYDALTADRPYRKAWTQEKVFEHIRQQAGLHFDPQIVDSFIELVQF